MRNKRTSKRRSNLLVLAIWLILIVAVPASLHAAERFAVFRSADRGRSWARADEGMPDDARVNAFGAVGESVIAGTDANGVLVSGDGGRSWRQQSKGLPDGAQVFALAAVSGRVFAGLYARGLYAWQEADQRWLKAGEVTPLALASVGDALVAGHNPGGIQWSDDQGAYWARATVNKPGSSAPSLLNPADELSGEAPVWELASGGDLAVAGVATGIYRSEDQGRTWVRARQGLPVESPGVAFLVRGNLVLAGTVLAE